MKIRKRAIYFLFVLILLSTEFLHIDFFGGALRPYHFFVPFVIFSLLRYINKIARTGIFLALVGFFFSSVLAALFADSSLDGFKSLGLLAANMSIAIAVALILVSGNLELRHLINTALGVAIVSVLLGVVQLVMLYAVGVDLSFTPGQTSQLASGFAIGLKTEANTFAKFLNVVFLLMLPTFLNDKDWRRVWLAFAIIVAGMLTSFTRSALYGLLVTLIIAYVWYFSSGRGRAIARRPLIAVVLVVITLSAFATIVVYFNPYAAHKLALFFDTEEVLEGGSSGFRLMSQGILWDAFLTTDKTFWIGNGWGQVRFLYDNTEMQAGGAEIVTALAYDGLIGGMFYLLYQLTAIDSVRRIIMANRDSAFLQASQGVMLALIGLFVTGQITGSMNSPEYWMVLGMAIAVVVKRRKVLIEKSRQRKVSPIYSKQR